MKSCYQKWKQLVFPYQTDPNVFISHSSNIIAKFLIVYIFPATKQGHETTGPQQISNSNIFQLSLIKYN